ncbi:N-acetylneuraminate synthase family protein [Desertibacillus haloalkaliphilus]|uniref:N-acetylneuraminate synthase family protein n=1 Tax=Desertibacillus haloalkaliphilus TaxID=1328930 RepID=UPI001C252383|nr:N-acetylneuraminate synthase family protein [Desertibacillus haloalkaliphilus]MBU8907590.1 N-acetylneuraminate synthase family protein [Desertibacillus haloalkaliphilus]
MTEMIKPFVTAEIGCNHKGDLDLAKEMIKIAALYCDVDAVKFQKRTPKELLTKEEYNAPHPNPVNSYGKTYGEHREYLELTLEQHKELVETCKQWDVEYSTSVWDLTSAKEITSLNPTSIKVPSACNLHFEMLEYLADHYRGEIQLSFGMTSQEEEEKIIDFFKKKKRNKDLVIYSCVSGYPVPFEDLSLLDITRIKNKFEKDVKGIGFSGHHLGIAPDVAALTLGAKYVERHYTLDRTWKGTDHSASLEPHDLRQLVVDLRNVASALTFKEQEILEIEKVQRKKLKRG